MIEERPARHSKTRLNLLFIPLAVAGSLMSLNTELVYAGGGPTPTPSSELTPATGGGPIEDYPGTCVDNWPQQMSGSGLQQMPGDGYTLTRCVSYGVDTIRVDGFTTFSILGISIPFIPTDQGRNDGLTRLGLICNIVPGGINYISTSEATARVTNPTCIPARNVNNTTGGEVEIQTGNSIPEPTPSPTSIPLSNPHPFQRI